MVDLLKLFQKSPDDPETRVDASDQQAEGLEPEFRDIIVEQLVRGGVDPDCVTLEIRQLGHATDGKQVYMGMMRLAQWNERSALRLLLGLPLLQAKVRRQVRSSWLEDLCHFGGLWLHPSGQFEETEAMERLRVLLIRLEQITTLETGEAPQQSVWSLPPELRGDDSGSEGSGR